MLGKPVTAIGLVDREEMDCFTANMKDVGARARFIPLPAATRRRLDTINSGQVLEQEEAVDPGILDQLLGTVGELAADANVICASGSVPPGLPPDTYARLGAVTRKLNRPLVLDARGVHLARGLAARSFVVKPDLGQLAEHVGRALKTPAAIAAALDELCIGSVGIAVASLGAGGAMAAAAGTIWQVRQPEITAINPAGSGDAFVAGLAAGMMDKLDISRCLAWPQPAAWPTPFIPTPAR